MANAPQPKRHRLVIIPVLRFQHDTVRSLELGSPHPLELASEARGRLELGAPHPLPEVGLVVVTCCFEPQHGDDFFCEWDEDEGAYSEENQC